MLYPSMANIWNAHLQKKLIASCETDFTGMTASGDTSYECEFAKARAYNRNSGLLRPPGISRFLRRGSCAGVDGLSERAREWHVFQVF